MIVLVARYVVKSGHGDEVEETLRRMAPFVHDQEPGCKMYQVNRSPENRDHFLLYEQYEDTAAFEAHRITPHFRELIEGTVIPLLERREREIYELVIP